MTLGVWSSNVPHPPTVIPGELARPGTQRRSRAKRAHPCYTRNMRDRTYYTYLLASRRNGTLYTGVTNDIYAR